MDLDPRLGRRIPRQNHYPQQQGGYDINSSVRPQPKPAPEPTPELRQRAYAPAHPALVRPPKHTQRPVKKRKLRKLLVYIIPTSLAVAVVALFVAFFIHQRLLIQPDPISSDIISSVSYPLYYARTLPQGFSEDKASPPTLQGGVVTLRYHYQDHQMVVNFQPRPASANLPEPYRLKDVSTPIGPAYVANINNQPAGIIEGSKTLVFITSDDKLDPDTIANFMRSLAAAS